MGSGSKPCSGPREHAGESDRPELNPLHHPPGRVGTVGIAHLLKTKGTEVGQEGILKPGTTDATAPEFRILLKTQRHRPIANDVADGHAPTRTQHPADVGQKCSTG